jgi:hypothetical protein
MAESLGNSKESHGTTPKTLGKNIEKMQVSPQNAGLGTQKPKKKRIFVRIYMSAEEKVRLKQLAEKRGFDDVGLMFRTYAEDMKLLAAMEKFKQLIRIFKEFELGMLEDEVKL